MKNRNKHNAGFTLMELLVCVAIVAVIAFFGMRTMSSINPEGWETVEVVQVLTGEEGRYALTEAGDVIPVAKGLEGKIKSGTNRVQINKDAAGIRTITGFKNNEGAVSSAGQKKSLTTLPTITVKAETLALVIGFLTLGLTVGVFLRGRASSPSPSQSDEPAEAAPAPAAKAKVKVTAPPAPPASEPRTAVEAAFQKAETAG